MTDYTIDANIAVEAPATHASEANCETVAVAVPRAATHTSEATVRAGLQKFFDLVLPETGPYCYAEQPYSEAGKPLKFRGNQNGGSTQVELIEKLIEVTPTNRPANLFFATGSYKGGSRSADNCTGKKSLYLDFDLGDFGYDWKYPDKGCSRGEAMTLLRKDLGRVAAVLGMPTAMVNSGNGMHVYWALTASVSKEDWLATADLLKQFCVQENIQADRTATMDAARLLRVPFSANSKDPEHPKPVTMQITDAVHDLGALHEKLIHQLRQSTALVGKLAPSSPANTSNGSELFGEESFNNLTSTSESWLDQLDELQQFNCIVAAVASLGSELFDDDNHWPEGSPLHQLQSKYSSVGLWVALGAAIESTGHERLIAWYLEQSATGESVGHEAANRFKTFKDIGIGTLISACSDREILGAQAFDFSPWKSLSALVAVDNSTAPAKPLSDVAAFIASENTSDPAMQAALVKAMLLPPGDYALQEKQLAEDAGVSLSAFRPVASRCQTAVTRATAPAEYDGGEEDAEARRQEQIAELWPNMAGSAPEEQCGATLRRDIAGFLGNRIHQDASLMAVLPAWVLHTWMYDLFRYTPYLNITSATKQSGKTHVGEVVGGIAKNILSAANASPAALYRLGALDIPFTMFLDEMDNIKNPEKLSDLNAVLNAGFKVGGAVIRCVGDDNAVKRFPCFYPKILVGIGSLTDTVADRCIAFPMRRKPTKVKTTRESTGKEQHSLQRRCARWAEDNAAAVKQAYDDIIKEGGYRDLRVADRAQDIWEPLWAIARVIDATGQWEQELVATAGETKKWVVEEDDKAVMALEELYTFWIVMELRQRQAAAQSGGNYCFGEVDWVSNRALRVMALCRADRPWETWAGGRAISPHAFSKLVSSWKPEQKKVWVKHGEHAIRGIESTSDNRLPKTERAILITPDLQEVFKNHLPTKAILRQILHQWHVDDVAEVGAVKL